MPTNCSPRARNISTATAWSETEDLRIAARLNAEAASLLGTMYASGHCVGQNLAPAYRWYARALHRDPGNARYKTDLEVLWKQMTPQDKQAALRIAP